MLAVRQTIPGRARPGTPAPLVLQTTEEDNMNRIELCRVEDARDTWLVRVDGETKSTIWRVQSGGWCERTVPIPPQYYDEFGDAVGAVVADLVAGCSELEK